MSGEGELKKRILELNENGLYSETEYSLSAHDVFEILDDARKEFPIESWKLHSKSTVSYEESAKVIDWFLKWFEKLKVEG